MKPQDIVFGIILGTFLALKNPLLFAWTGLLMLSISLPLFALHIFFTAERLTWYAAAFFLFFILFSFTPSHKVK
ncbi:MAG: hypothetical protein AAB492_00520 [Patescibacteria group bacterium]